MSMYIAADDYSLSPLLSLVIAGPLDMVDMEDRVLPDTVPRGHNIAISNYQGGEKEFQTFCFPVKFAVQQPCSDLQLATLVNGGVQLSTSRAPRLHRVRVVSREHSK